MMNWFNVTTIGIKQALAAASIPGFPGHPIPEEPDSKRS
jgi:hypothetical protein